LRGLTISSSTKKIYGFDILGHYFFLYFFGIKGPGLLTSDSVKWNSISSENPGIPVLLPFEPFWMQGSDGKFFPINLSSRHNFPMSQIGKNLQRPQWCEPISATASDFPWQIFSDL